MQIDFEVRDALEINTRDLDRAIYQAIEDVAYFFNSNVVVRDELAYPPGPVHYPIQWTSEKQRKAFFATDGFGRGIPTRRTGYVNRSWVYTPIKTPDGGILVFRNTAPYAKFVFGSFDDVKPKQRFHTNTGWTSLHTQTGRIIDQLADSVHEEIQRQLNAVILKRV